MRLSIRPSILLPRTTLIKTYATASQGKGGRPEAAPPDPRNDIIRRTLYPERTPNVTGLVSSPTGVHRPDVALALERAIPSAEAHETIERAWLLHKRQLRWKREAESQRKWDCMHRAMEELHQLDTRLFHEANRPEDSRIRSPQLVEQLKKARGAEKKILESRLPGLFPREMRIPTDTPPRSGWNYDWKPLMLPSP